MYKLVVLAALVAVAAGKAQEFQAPLVYSTGFETPLTFHHSPTVAHHTVATHPIAYAAAPAVVKTHEATPMATPAATPLTYSAPAVVKTHFATPLAYSAPVSYSTGFAPAPLTYSAYHAPTVVKTHHTIDAAPLTYSAGFEHPLGYIR